MRGIGLGLIALVAALGIACGSDPARDATRTPAVPPSPSAQASASPPVATPTSPVVSATPPLGEPPTISAPAPPRTPPPGTHLEPAPIDAADIVVRESFPPQYAVHIVSGMPSGCHQFESAATTRSGDVITVDVENRVEGGPDAACTAIYGTHESNVGLGSDFVPGQTYIVHVNDRTLELHAQ